MGACICLPPPVDYEGDTNKEGEKHGFGKFSHLGTMYEGQFERNNMNGHGKMIWYVHLYRAALGLAFRWPWKAASQVHSNKIAIVLSVIGCMHCHPT